jgi:hypothetical protein
MCSVIIKDTFSAHHACRYCDGVSVGCLLEVQVFQQVHPESSCSVLSTVAQLAWMAVASIVGPTSAHACVGCGGVVGCFQP